MIELVDGALAVVQSAALCGLILTVFAIAARWRR